MFKLVSRKYWLIYKYFFSLKESFRLNVLNVLISQIKTLTSMSDTLLHGQGTFLNITW